MSIADSLQREVQAALRAGERLRLDVLRMLAAAVKQKQIDGGQVLDEAGFAAIVRNLIKQRRDSAEQFRKGGREELAVREEEEISILEPFLPPAPDAGEVAAAVERAISESGASSAKDMGKVMAHIKAAMPAADMGEVSKLVRQKLS